MPTTVHVGWRPLSGSQTRRDLRLSVADGVACTIMVACGEMSLPLFAVAAGLGAFGAAAVATAPMLVGAVVQALAPLAMGRARSPRRWVIGCVVIQALSFLPIAVWAFRGKVGLAELLVAVSVYWSAGMASLAAWNVWMAALVPQPVRPTYFAFRTRLALCGIIVGLVSSASVLHLGDRWGMKMAAFGGLFVVATLARMVSASCMAACGEPARSAAAGISGAAGPPKTLRDIVGELVAAIQGMASRPSGMVVAYLVCFVFGAQVAAPYLSPFWLEQRHLTDAMVVGLMAVGFVARLLVLPSMGRLAAARGAEQLMRWSTLALACVTVLWLASGHPAYLVPVQFVAGSSWAAYELAVTLLLFNAVTDRERVAVVTVHILGTTAAAAAGAACGGAVLARFGGGLPGYAAVFLASAAVQGAALLIGTRVRPSSR